MAELAFPLLCLVALAALAGSAWLWLSLWWERPPAELALPRVIPVRVCESNGEGPEEVPPAPIPLSKFRLEHRARARRRAPRRALQPRATLPRTGTPGCQNCKGVALVWTTDPEGLWTGLCRRCGLPFASVPHEGWQAPVPRPLPSSI